MDDSTVRKIAFTDTDISVVIEDDGQVIYGYLMSDQMEIIGDVWIANRIGAI
jgi:hypothetical protein